MTDGDDLVPRASGLRNGLGAWRARTFASLDNTNYRRFFVGQAVSLVGTWMQSVA